MYFLQEVRSVTLTLAFNAGSDSANPLKADSIDIWIDGVRVIADGMDASLAVCCLMAAYYVYGIEYPVNLRKTLLFLQKFIFDLEENVNIPVSVLRAYNMLA